MKCPACDAEIPDGEFDCPECGSGVEPGWMQKASEAALAWLSQDVEKVEAWVREQRSAFPDLDRPALAWRAIRDARYWSGNAGFVAGLGDFLGPWGFAAGTVADVGFAAKLAVQMAQRIHAIYGFDLRDDETKVLIMARLGGGSAVAGQVAGRGTQKVGKRLAEKYLRGALLKAIKAFFRRLNIAFTRKAVIAWLPVVGSGVNLVVNSYLMEKLGKEILKALGEGPEGAAFCAK